MVYNPSFLASDIGNVGIDIVAGTGAAILPFAPLIGLGIVLKTGKETGLLKDFGLQPKNKKTDVSSFFRKRNSGKVYKSRNFTVFD